METHLFDHSESNPLMILMDTTIAYGLDGVTI